MTTNDFPLSEKSTFIAKRMNDAGAGRPAIHLGHESTGRATHKSAVDHSPTPLATLSFNASLDVFSFVAARCSSQQLLTTLYVYIFISP